MKNYIAYLDLLGIKDLAKYSSDKYFSAMEDFRNHLIATATIFNDPIYSSNSEIFFFSDSAFIESDNLETLFNYLILLRQALNRNNLFFTAAVTTGNLQAYNFNGLNDEKSGINDATKELIEGNEKFLKGTIFQSKEISNVYVLQNNLKGIGVYIHNSVFDKWKNEALLRIQLTNKNLSTNEINQLVDIEYKKFSNQYITQSFYFPSINTNTAYKFSDLRLTNVELDISFYEIIIERYHNSNVKNKKYGRFYLSHLANWISSVDFSVIQTVTTDGEVIEEPDKHETYLTEDNIVFENQPIIFTKLIMSEDALISELKKSAHCFEYLYFFLLDCLYKQFSSYNFIISQAIETINRNLKCKSYLTKIDELPDCVLSLENKERFIKDYHLVLNNLSKRKEQLNKLRKDKLTKIKKDKQNKENQKNNGGNDKAK